MKIDDLQTAQTAALMELFPRLGACDVHGGRFDLTELAAMSTKTPAIFVAALRIKSVEENGDGHSTATVTFSAFIVTTTERGLDRDVAAKNMAETVVAWLPNRRFGLEGVGAPTAVSASNLYSGRARSKAVSLWAVAWDQAVELGESDFVDGALPSHLYIGGELVEI